ncbi:MAG: 5'/3'-nucleotidase SurE [Acidobacteria bacterium]|nr:5'/3'-nucleotidase SurE [Acidobacteriota bacterium]
MRLLAIFLPILAFAQTPSLSIVLTNDDGYQAPGIAIVRGALQQAGHRVTVVAPRVDQSGKGMSFFTSSTARLNVAYDTTLNSWHVDGTPVDAVRVALEVLQLKPDVVISGANFGENLGVIANSSGTVGAAIWSINAGVPGIAVSAGLNFREATMNPPFPSTITAMQKSAEWIVILLARLQQTRRAGEPLMPEGAGFNVNFPAVDTPGGPAMTALSRGYNTLSLNLRAAPGFSTTTGGDVVLAAGPSGPAPDSLDKINDAEMFAKGYATITPLGGDWTSALSVMQQLRKRLTPTVE